MTPERIAELRKALEGVTDETPRERDYRVFLSGWARYDTSSSMDLERARSEFEAWYGTEDAATFNPSVVSELLDTVERLQEFYAATQEIRKKGLLYASSSDFQRRDKALAALTGGSND